MSNKSPIQKILFGPPGCGKSFHVRTVAKSELKIIKENNDNENKIVEGKDRIIETCFHPEYSYSDFVVKLLPVTKNDSGSSQVEYQVHEGPFLKALAKAYSDLNKPVLLVIDEINRGNCAHIFGDIFQLLDREEDGWSSYGIDAPRLMADKLNALIVTDDNAELKRRGILTETETETEGGTKTTEITKILLPPNLSIIGTMNTSDESIFYMDTAFKRRWGFEYMHWCPDGEEGSLSNQKKAFIEGHEYAWESWLQNLNDWIVNKSGHIDVEDKQIGLWFIKSESIPKVNTDLKKIDFLEGLMTAFSSGKIPSLDKLAEYLWSENNPIAGYNNKGALEDAIRSDVKKNCVDGIKLKNLIEKHLQKLEDNENVSSARDNVEDGKKRWWNIHNKDVVEEYNKYFSEIYCDLVGVINRNDIENKLMFYLWDNVFDRNRQELFIKAGFKGNEGKTFSDLTKKVDTFIDQIGKYGK